MFLAHQFHDLELERIWSLPIRTLAKWITYFQRTLKVQEEAIKTKVAPAKTMTSVKEHMIQFR